MAYARLSTPQDVSELAPKLRVEDVAEVKAASGHGAEHALRVGFAASHPCYSIIHEDRVISMFGVAPSARPEVGIVWLLSSPELRSIKQDFIEQTPKFIDEFHQRYAILTNLVDERNTLHVKWLKRVGFIFINRHERAGYEQRAFLEFVKCAIPS